ncbi:hypothetical protein XELAEV_18039952mg [Xenopus laevis]|uniref:Uncharacterized protein n=1 Tax=Xenopus laevis TaxID=8355 RepID=A0A974C8I5_XENLA|nr:hypothetical protein XELAEV_18039952mg [Xenopus laevis]
MKTQVTLNNPPHPSIAAILCWFLHRSQGILGKGPPKIYICLEYPSSPKMHVFISIEFCTNQENVKNVPL